MQLEQVTVQFDPLDILPNPFISAVSPLQCSSAFALKPERQNLP